MLNNLPPELIGRALSQNFSSEEDERRKEMALNKDYFYDKQEQSIELLNDDQSPTVLNILKPIVKKKTSLLYSQPPLREYVGSNLSIGVIENIYKENNIDQLLLQADLLAELTGSALILPVFNDNFEYKIQLRLYDASNITALANEDDSRELDAISIVQMVDRVVGDDLSVERRLKQQIWTPETIYKYEGNVLLGQEPNPYNMIPFVNFKGDEVYDQYFGHAPARGLRLLNETINRTLTDFGFSIKFQSFTPIALSGTRGDTVVSIHPGRAFNLPAGATAEVLQTNPKLADVLEYIKFLEEKAYELSNVPKISVIGGGDGNSGRELMIRWFPLLQVFQEKGIRWSKYEKALANTILFVLGIEPLEELNITYVKSSILPLTEENDTLKEDIELGIKTAADELMRRKPELSKEEAEAVILENVAFNDKMNSSNQEIGNDSLPPELPLVEELIEPAAQVVADGEEENGE
jgi:hypothetical protein